MDPHVPRHVPHGNILQVQDFLQPAGILTHQRKIIGQLPSRLFVGHDTHVTKYRIHTSLDSCQEKLLRYVHVRTPIAPTILAALTCHPRHHVLIAETGTTPP